MFHPLRSCGPALAIAILLIVAAGCGSQPSLAPELLQPFPPQAEIVTAWQAGIHPGSRVDDGLVTLIRPDWEEISTPPASGLRTYTEILTRSGGVAASGAFERVLAGALGISSARIERAELRGVSSRQLRSVNDLGAVSGTYIWAVWYVDEATAAFGSDSGGDLRLELDPNQQLLRRVAELGIDFDLEDRVVKVGTGSNLALAAQFISLDAHSRRGDRVLDLATDRLHELPFGYRASVLEFFWNHGDVVFELLNPLAGAGLDATIVRLHNGRSISVRYEPGQLAGVPGAVSDVFTYHAERDAGGYTGRARVVVHRTERQWAAAKRGQLSR